MNKKKKKNETLVTFREKKTKKKLSFVAKLTQVSIAETQPNPTKKARRNVSKRFLKNNTKNLKLTQEPRYPIKIGGNLQKKSKSRSKLLDSFQLWSFLLPLRPEGSTVEHTIKDRRVQVRLLLGTILFPGF